jgi:hypothetical protein
MSLAPGCKVESRQAVHVRWLNQSFDYIFENKVRQRM